MSKLKVLKNIDVYNENAAQLSAQYSLITFETAHQSWEAFWPTSACGVLDVGAGDGRDAKWFEHLGCDVTAVEPANALREIGQKNTGSSVKWLNDQLPELQKVQALGIRFDVILLSAVWMHIPPSERDRCFRKLSNLLAPNGILVVTLRHGVFSDGRTAFPVSAEEIQKLANRHALLNEHCTDKVSDQLGRADVQWQTLVFRLPDDGSGSLTKIRKVIVNDSKSTTYKLALLRTLVRIADAHPGAVIDRSDGKVLLPLGLVAIYWIRLYKRLITPIHDIQQSSNTNKGLSFIKQEGWGQLISLHADDFAIGAFFSDKQAQALQKLMSDSIKTIQDGPVTFTYHADKSNKLFSIVKHKRNVLDSFVIDRDFLSSFGYFVLDEAQWECFRLYGSWIDPLLVQQWITEMKRYKSNQERQYELQTYHDALQWLDKDHDTSLVRKKIATLLSKGEMISSVWSDTKLTHKIHIDHCLPFSYWPNNDKWNLLPSTEKENLSKRDRLPSAERLTKSRSRILDWWQIAWQSPAEIDRFFHEATLSLPNICQPNKNFDDVFEAMQFQVHGVKQRLQINEW